MSFGLRSAVLALVTIAGAAAAAPAPPGAASCSGCHRPPGAGGAVPALYGRPAEETIAAMRAYRRGERDPSVMNRIATGFDDGEVRAIAAWLEQQR